MLVKKITYGLRIQRLKMKEWKEMFYTTEDQKKAEVALFISGNVDFNTKTVIGDEGHCIMINRSMQQEDITLVFMNLIQEHLNI